MLREYIASMCNKINVPRKYAEENRSDGDAIQHKDVKTKNNKYIGKYQGNFPQIF